METMRRANAFGVVMFSETHGFCVIVPPACLLAATSEPRGGHMSGIIACNPGSNS